MILKDLSQIIDKSSQKSLQIMYKAGGTVKCKELKYNLGRNSYLATSAILKNTGVIKETSVSSFWGKKQGYELTPIGKYIALMLKSETEKLNETESKYLEDYSVFNQLFEIKTVNRILETLYNANEFLTYNQLLRSAHITGWGTQEIRYITHFGLTDQYKKGMGLLLSSYDYRISELGKKVYENYHNLNSNELKTNELVITDNSTVIEEKKSLEPIINPNLIKNKFPPREPHPNFNPYVNNNQNDLSKKEAEIPEVIEKEEIKDEFKELCHKKGKDFETYTMDNLFPKETFDLLHVTPDAETNEKRYVESSRKPDLQFRDKKTGKIFYVECKYRSSLFNEKYEWTKSTEQAERYRNIEYLEEIPVYIAMGLMGTPENPKKVFLMPLKDIKYNAMFLSVLKDYEIKEAGDIFKILNS